MDIEAKAVLWAKNKICLKYPFTQSMNRHIYLGKGEYADILGFGFSYIEHEDHMVGFIITSPKIMKKIIQEVDELQLIAEQPYIGEIWTARLYMSDKVKDSNIIFSNPDLSCILDLDINKITYPEEFYDANV